MGGEDGETAQSPGFLTVLVAGEKPWKTTDARAGRGGSGGPGNKRVIFTGQRSHHRVMLSLMRSFWKRN